MDKITAIFQRIYTGMRAAGESGYNCESAAVWAQSIEAARANRWPGASAYFLDMAARCRREIARTRQFGPAYQPREF
jgi:hypothetical protein